MSRSRPATVGSLECDRSALTFAVFVVATSKLLEERSDMTMGVRANAPPRVRPWGMYGFGVHDPNGVPVNG